VADINCKACKHFQDHGVMGVCRRYPTFVNRHHTEVCGEFAAPPVKIAPEMIALPVMEMSDEPKKRGRPRIAK